MQNVKHKKMYINKLFFYGNYILLAIMAYFISRVSIYTSILVFSISFTSIFLNKRASNVIVGISAIFGLLSLNNYNITPKYILIIITLLILSNMIVVNKREINRFGQAAISTIVMLLFGLIYSLFSSEILYSIVLCILEGILNFILSILFSYSTNLLNFNSDKKTYTQEELISLTIIISVAITGTFGITILQIDMFSLLAYIMLLYIGYVYGPGLGSAAGVTLGLLINISLQKDPMVVILLSISGIAAGLFRELGKWASIVGLVIGNLLFVLYAFEPNMYLTYLITVLAACFMFMLIPIDGIKRIKSFINKKTNVTSQDYLERIQEVTSNKLKVFSDTFDQLAITFDSISEKRVALNKDDVSKLMDEVVSQVCQQCEHLDTCWEKKFYNTYQTVYSIIHAADNKGVIEYKDIPESFYKQCYRYKDFIKATNKIYEIYTINLNWYNRMIDSRRLVSTQLKGISGIMNNLSTDIKKNITFDKDIEKEINLYLEDIQVFADNILVYVDEDEKFIVELYISEKNMGNQTISKIVQVADKVLNTKTIVSSRIGINKGLCKLVLKEKRLYKVSTGVARVAKEALSGDNFSSTPINEGKHLVALSDGMGTGYKANKESTTTIELLEQLLTSGFDNDTAIKMINSLLILKSTEDCFSTLDFALINLHTGVCQIIKMGGASIFILGKDKIRIINSTTLPMGILEKVDMDRHQVKLSHGDLLIMVTDGVIDALQNNWSNAEIGFKDIIKDIKSNNPQKIANEMLKNITDNMAQVEDDMTIVVSRIWKER